MSNERTCRPALHRNFRNRILLGGRDLLKNLLDDKRDIKTMKAALKMPEEGNISLRPEGEGPSFT